MPTIPDRPEVTRYGPPPTLGVRPEGGGFTATCACSWVRWWADRKHAATEYVKHLKGCKAVGE